MPAETVGCFSTRDLRTEGIRKTSFSLARPALLSLILGIALLLCLAVRPAYADYYIHSDDKLDFQENSPKDIENNPNILYWGYLFFRVGQSPEPHRAWGMTTRKTLGELEANLKRLIEDEKRVTSRRGERAGDKSFSNYLGPIAYMKSSHRTGSAGSKSSFLSLDGVWGYQSHPWQAWGEATAGEQLESKFQNLDKLLRTLPGGTEAIGSELGEHAINAATGHGIPFGYAYGLRMSLGRLQHLRGVLEQSLEGPSNDLQSLIEELEEQSRQIRQLREEAAKQLTAKQPTTQTPQMFVEGDPIVTGRMTPDDPEGSLSGFKLTKNFDGQPCIEFTWLPKGVGGDPYPGVRVALAVPTIYPQKDVAGRLTGAFVASIHSVWDHSSEVLNGGNPYIYFASREAAQRYVDTIRALIA